MNRARAILLLACGSALAQTAPERWSGSFDVRNRFLSDVDGSSQVYRSVVNLGEGPRIFGADARYRNPSNRWADELAFDSSAWGGDPYNNARLEARRARLYELRTSYRNTAYFNNLPSFANPLLGEGLLLSQQALDVTRRQFDLDLEIKPASWVSPFISFYRGKGFGRGRTTFVGGANEYLVDSLLDDRLTSIRAGAKIEPKNRKWSLLLEQGRTAFGDDERRSFDGGANPGNRRRPFLGSSLSLDRLRQQYRARGSGLTERGVFRAQPSKRFAFTAQFVYSQPSLDVTESLDASGVFADQSSLRFFRALNEQSVGDASRPHSTASTNAEWRVTSRLRIHHGWYTDRYHVSAASSLTQTLSAAPSLEAGVNRLVFRYNQSQTDVIFDPTKRVSLRGGHRYVWGDARARQPSLTFSQAVRGGELRRHIALGAARVRASKRLNVSVDLEASPGDRTFFRTGLMEYQKAKARARYRLGEGLTLSGAYSMLNNRNPDPLIDFDFRRRATSISLQWTSPNGRVTLLGDYTRSTLRSDIRTVEPPFLAAGLSQYRDNAHLASGLLDVKLPLKFDLTAGGSFSTSSGSRPTDFYQPRVSLAKPLNDRIRWVAEWRWYRFHEEFLQLENFRLHSVSAGLIGSF